MEPKHDSGLGAFFRSPVGIVLAAFLAIAGFLLVTEHRAHIVAGDWGLALLFLVSIGAHFLMHGSHGGHRGRHTDASDTSPSRDDLDTRGDRR